MEEGKEEIGIWGCGGGGVGGREEEISEADRVEGEDLVKRESPLCWSKGTPHKGAWVRKGGSPRGEGCFLLCSGREGLASAERRGGFFGIGTGDGKGRGGRDSEGVGPLAL